MNSAPLIENLRVVLVSTRNPLNIGAAARAMSNFGCTHLRLVNPYDPAYREAVSAVGAAPVLASAEQFSTVAEAVADCALVVGTTAAGRRELHHSLCTLESGARHILQRLARKRPARGKRNRVALLFGSEKTGLSNEDLSHCHWLLRIPTRAEHRSMNLGQAVAICLYELIRGGPESLNPSEQTPASATEVERITQVMFQALCTSGYAQPSGEAAAQEKLRRLVRRLNLQTGDAEVWLGMMRQILWKTKHPGHETE